MNLWDGLAITGGAVNTAQVHEEPFGSHFVVADGGMLT